MSNLYVPPCPTSCAGSVADVDFDNCTPIYHWGEISKIYLGSTTVPDFADVSSIVEWNAILSETEDDHIRSLIVIGEQPEAETVEVPTSGDRIAIGYKKFSINAEIDETNDTNYNFHLMLECGGKFKLWYETSDGMLYGGNEGIEASVKTNQIIPKERTALVKIMLKATWNSLQSPFRCLSPMY
jgi:hypothetical protein